MKRICVFCGSSSGRNPVYREEARKLGVLFTRGRIELVYGGGNVGLMGILADSIIENGGTCTGIIPRSIADLEIAHTGLTRLHIVETMHERKSMMAELSDGFIALPGGFGTLDELSEILTYNQLRIYDKPVGILNTYSYFDGLLSFFDHCVAERFIRAEHKDNLMVSENAEELIELMQAYKPVHIDKWIDDIKEERELNMVNSKKQ
jgi:uncharacterized protein (TIGR00730 family)